MIHSMHIENSQKQIVNLLTVIRLKKLEKHINHFI